MPRGSCKGLPAAGLPNARGEPLIKRLQPVWQRKARRPIDCGSKRGRVADVPGLIARTPASELEIKTGAGELRDHADQFEQAHRIGRTASEIEDPPAQLLAAIEHGNPCVRCITDMERIANLAPVSENRQRLATKCRKHEMGDPALILGSILAGAVNAAHAKDG